VRTRYQQKQISPFLYRLHTNSRTNAESPVLDVEIELTGTDTYSAQRDRVFSIFFENPFLYNRTEYVLIDGGITETNPDTNERWVKGTVTVMEHGDYRNIETPSTWSVQHEINTSGYNRLDLENSESGEAIVAIENGENTLLLFDDAGEKENLSSMHTKTFEDAVSRIEHYFRSDDPLIPKSDETG